MSLRIRHGGQVEGTPPVEPPPSGNYAFPTTTFTFPVLADDGGTAANDGMINVADYGIVPNVRPGPFPLTTVRRCNR